MADVEVSGVVRRADQTAPRSGRIAFAREQWDFGTRIFTDEPIVATINSSGVFSVTLRSTTDLEGEYNYDVTLRYYDEDRRNTVRESLGKISVPAAGGPFDLTELLAVPTTTPDVPSVAAQAVAAQAVVTSASLVAATTVFGTRGQFVTSNNDTEGLGRSDGKIVIAGGLIYKRASGSTAIADLHGWVPAGQWTPEHFGDTTSANCTSVVDAASVAAAAAAVPLHFEGRTYRGSFKAANNGTWFGVINKTILRVHEAAASSDSTVYFNLTGSDGVLTNFLMSGFIVDGSKTTLLGECGFLTWGFQNLRFEDCLFQNAEVYGWAAQSRPGFSRAETQDELWMTRCGFKNNGTSPTRYDGIDIKYATNMYFTDCWATGNSNSGFNLRGTAFINGLHSWSNGTDNIKLQSTDLSATYPSRFELSNIYSGATTAALAPGIRFQASALNPTYINGTCEAGYALGPNIEFSGAGQISGTLLVTCRQGSSHGIHITGDYIASLNLRGRIIANAGDGLKTAGKNLVVDMVISGNTGTGYLEDTGADNNVLLPTSIVTGNGTDIGTRVGLQTSDGWLSALTKLSMRVFPGQATYMDAEADGSGLYTGLRMGGDAASIGMRITTKGNGVVDFFHQNGSRQLGKIIQGSSSTENYFKTITAAVGNEPVYTVDGTDTNTGARFQSKGTGSAKLMSGNGTAQVLANNTGLGFFNTTPIAKPAVTGSRGGNAALASLLTQLAALGLITDSSS